METAGATGVMWACSRLCGPALKLPPDLKPLLLCLLASSRELCAPRQALASQQPLAGRWGPRWDLLGHQNSRGPPAELWWSPFRKAMARCVTTFSMFLPWGQLTELANKPILIFYITKPQEQNRLPTVVPSPPNPLLGKYLYFCAIYVQIWLLPCLNRTYHQQKYLKLAVIILGETDTEAKPLAAPCFSKALLCLM